MASDAVGHSRTVLVDGAKVRALRLRIGLTREALSEASTGSDALSVATIKRAEAGKPLYVSSASSLSRLLATPLPQLLCDGAAPDQSTKPVHRASLAVMPFDCREIGVDQRILVDGLVEDVINRLSLTWFPVIARASSFSWRDSGAEPSDSYQLLGAEYVLKGRAHVDAGGYRIMCRLIDAADDRVMWAGDFRAERGELLTVRDQLVSVLVSETANRVLEEEAQRASRHDPGQLDAWHLAVRGAWHFYQSTPDNLQEARRLLEQAIQRDHGLAFARFLILLSHQHDLLNQWSPDVAATVAEMRAHAVQFERACPGNPFMYVATAYAAVAAGDRAEAEGRLLEALEGNASLVPAHSLYGQVLAMGGRCDQGIHELELAYTLSPRDPGAWSVLMTTALAHFAAGRYDAAVDWARRAVTKRPHVPFVYAALAAALALRGDVNEARDALAHVARRNERLGLRGIGAVVGSTSPDISERFIAGLRLAGMPAR